MTLRNAWQAGGLPVTRDSVFAQGNHMAGDHMGGYGHMMNSWGGMVIMGLVGLIVIAVLVYLLVSGSRTGGGFRPFDRETPLDILKRRYAKGEINKEQYEEMKKDL